MNLKSTWRGEGRVDYLGWALIIKGKPEKKRQTKKRGGLAAMGDKKERILKSLVRPAVRAGAGAVEEVSKKTLSDDNKLKGRKKSEWILFVPESGPTDDQLFS
jgi:hypothetical protein